MENIRCDFCGIEYKRGSTIMFRADVDSDLYICETCIKACNYALSTSLDKKDNEEIDFLETISPSEMKAYFDKYIINQEQAKKILSVSTYNHSKRVIYNREIAINKESMKIKKSNVLMVGPSGSGKTLFIETIARKLNIPYAIADATTLTEAGYVGDDVETILRQLIKNANEDVKKAETGIVFLDEIDKIGRKGENVSITRDVSGEGVRATCCTMKSCA